MYQHNDKYLLNLRLYMTT